MTRSPPANSIATDAGLRSIFWASIDASSDSRSSAKKNGVDTPSSPRKPSKRSASSPSTVWTFIGWFACEYLAMACLEWLRAHGSGLRYARGGCFTGIAERSALLDPDPHRFRLGAVGE